MNMFASIDIGTNSVLLLIGEPAREGGVRVACDRMIVTRLGAGLHETGRISDEAAGRTLDALRVYSELCARHKVKSTAVIGTAALRSASNAIDFILAVRQEFGLEIEVISPEREARLTYSACARDFGTDIVVMDIGGGSTEFISPDNLVSLPVGCVSLTERFLRSDPATKKEISALGMEIRRNLESALDPASFARPHDRKLIAVAGTATTLMAMNLKLGAYDAGRVHGQTLKTEHLRKLLDDLRPKTIEERKQITGLDPKRADVILAGAELLHSAMSSLGFAAVTISDRGVKWGLFYEKFCAR